MRRGRLRKLRAGTLLPWTRPPYGYRLDPERPRDPAGVRLDEAEAAVVRDLFAWFADEGATILALTQRLARLGLASPRAHRTWNASALRGVLTNPTYLGQIFANRARTRPAERRHSALLPIGRGLTGARQSLDAAEWIAVAAVPALVGQAQFDRAQERLAYNRRMARRNNRVHAYLRRGLVSCSRPVPDGLHRPPHADDGLRLLRLPDQDADAVRVARWALPRALHPGSPTGGAGLARPVRGAVGAGDGGARDGAGARRALAAAGDAGAPGQPAARPGGSRPTRRAAHRGLPRRRGVAGRVRAPPARHRRPPAGARWSARSGTSCSTP